MPTLNFDAIPPWVAEQIAKDTIEAVERCLAQPGGKEFLRKQAEKYGIPYAE